MKGFITFLVLAAVIVGGYLILKKPVVAPTEEIPAESSDAPMNGDTTPDASIDGTKEFDATKSSATWTGSKSLIKDYVDHGTINVKAGNAVFAKGILTGGNVVFDMNSITTLSTGRGSDADATSQQAKHMKSEDFFDTLKYPEAKFVVTSAVRESGGDYILTGDLTIKDKTNPVTFPVEVTSANGIVTLSGAVTLDRTLWDIKYGSSKFFPNLGDKVINDEFGLEFKAVTK